MALTFWLLQSIHKELKFVVLLWMDNFISGIWLMGHWKALLKEARMSWEEEDKMMPESPRTHTGEITLRRMLSNSLDPCLLKFFLA
jgi:hypothetical protein